MDSHKAISDVLQGKTRVIFFDDLALGADKDITARVLCALNFARLALATERNTPVPSQIIASLSSKKTVENALGICREWPGDVHLQVEDVYHMPLFETSLKLVSTDYDAPTPDHITTLLEDMRALGSSSAILMTRYPDAVACLRLRVAGQDVFVVFNPRASSERDHVVTLTFSTSPSQIVQRLCEVFPVEKARPGQGSLRWQPNALQKCTGHVFFLRTASHDDFAEDEPLMVSSLMLLTLRAELDELTRDNGTLKKDKVRLEKSIVDLGAQLEEAKMRAKRTQSSRPSVAKHTVAPAPSFASTQRWESPQPPRPNRARERLSPRSDGTDVDPSVQYARQLQATFDSENEFLLMQKHDLMRTAQRQYHCGVCLDDFPEDDAVRIGGCSHEVCRTCARGHVCSKIEEHRFPVLCPVCMADPTNKDPATIPSTVVQLLGVSEEEWATWVEMELAQFSISIDCRKCHHSGFVDRADVEAENEIHCPFPACDHVWCKKCQQTIESGGPEHSCDGTTELDHLVKQQGWRYCPNCKTPIQKIQGCNHLSCIAPGCNTHFCYGCGETINRTAIPREIQEGKAAHFRTCNL